MFRILATKDHVRDYVSKGNKPRNFETKEAANRWVEAQEVNGTVYKVTEYKPRKAKPLHRHYRRRKATKMVSLEEMVEKQVVKVR